MPEIPVVKAADTFGKLDLVAPTQAVEARDVAELAHGAVGLRGVPFHPSPEADCLPDAFGEFGDGGLETGANVYVAVAHRLAAPAAFLRKVREADIQEDVDRSVGHVLAPEELTEGFSGAPEAQGLPRYSARGESCADFVHSRGIGVNAVHRPLAEVGAEVVFPAFAEQTREMHLADHGGKNVGIVEMEIIVRAIEIRGHDGHVVRAVLKVYGLAHLHAGDFRYGVGLVGVFEGGREQSVLGNGLGSLTRVYTGASEEQKPLHAVAQGRTDDVLLYAEVLEDKVGAVDGVGHDSAHVSGGKHHGVGLFLVEEPFYGRGVEEVEFGMGAPDHIPEATRPEVRHDGGANEAAVSGHVDL